MGTCVFRLQSLFSLILPCILLSCAGQVPPGGGPSDTDPPRIISVSPAPYSTLYHGNTIVLEFDEYVDRHSVEESIFISPSVGELSFEWSGTEVEIQFGDTLKENTTYVVNVGTDVQDTRNRNRMAQAFSLAFSTGTQIDRGAIEGRIHPSRTSDSPDGVMVFAYKLDGGGVDTLNPRTVRPDYVTQVGKDGTFFLYHLVLGTYRLFAIRDEYKNLLYDPETDEYGAPPGDVRLTESDTLSGGMALQLAKEDTTAPRLIKVSSLNSRLLLAEFSESIDTSSVRTARLTLSDTLGRKPVAVETVAPKLPKRNEFFLVTDSLIADVLYQLRVDGMRDEAGLPVSGLASTVQFTSSGQRDTTKPAVGASSVSDSVRDVPLQPELAVFLTEPVRRVRSEEIVTLQDSTGATVASRAEWLNAAGLTLRPLKEFSPKAWYRLSVNIPLLADPSGNRGEDSIQVVHFETVDSDRFSSVEGIVQDANTSDTGRIFLSAINMSRPRDPAKAVSVARPGPFSIGGIVEGQYTIHAYRDKNRNRVFDAGSVFPFAPSERFSYYRDTLRVRARWPVEGVLIQLK